MSFVKIRKQWLADCEKIYGLPKGSNKNRRSGRTTACALNVISEAMMTPDATLKLWDHTEHGQPLPKQTIKRTVLPTVLEILEKLELDGFIVNRTALTIRYSLK